jgi:hypothetical protein
VITPPGTHPEDCDNRPEWPHTATMWLSYREDTSAQSYTATAWAVGTDCARATREWTVDRWMVEAYPEMWAEGLRRLAAGVQRELEQAGTWLPRASDRENAVHGHGGAATPERPPAP